MRLRIPLKRLESNRISMIFYEIYNYSLDEIEWLDDARRVNFLEDSDFVEED